MKNEDDVRKAGDWEIIHALQIGDTEVVFGENTANPSAVRYLCAYCQQHDLFRGYSGGIGGDDYLEIMQLYIERVKCQIDMVRAEMAGIPLPKTPVIAEQCYPNDLSKSIEGRIVAIRADVLRREYRIAQQQLVLVDGGFGASAIPAAARFSLPTYTAASVRASSAGMFWARSSRSMFRLGRSKGRRSCGSSRKRRNGRSLSDKDECPLATEPQVVFALTIRILDRFTILQDEWTCGKTNLTSGFRKICYAIR